MRYNGHTWELHPIIVEPAFRGKGTGTRLVHALEEQIREKGETNEITIIPG